MPPQKVRRPSFPTESPVRHTRRRGLARPRSSWVASPRMADSLVLTGDDGPVRVVTPNRPDARNALSVALQRDLAAALVAARGDDAVSCIVLTGADPAFCAGLDLKELGQGTA